MERYVLDFYCPAVRLAIELDGNQHADPEQKARDDERSAWLAEQGVRVVRFWNGDVLARMDRVLEAILMEIELGVPDLTE